MTAQQAAIQEARARYERGELSFEAFRRALDALVLARNADECQAILRALPASPLASLSALEAPRLLSPASAPESRRTRFVAFMSQVKKLRRSWQLAPEAHVVAFMGEAKLDLGLAHMPPHARLQITAIMGTVVIYVPRSLHVAVRARVFLSDTNSLGESAGGVVTFAHEEHSPLNEPPAAQLEIEVFALMSNVKVVLTDGPVVSISELVRDALRAAAAGIQRGLRQGTAPRPLLDTGGATEQRS